MNQTPNRREAIKTFGRATAIGAAQAAIVGIAVHATQAHGATIDSDASILAAFSRWTDAYRVIRAHHADDEDETPSEAAAWAVIDQAEMFIVRTPAQSLPAAECALWIALAHIDDPCIKPYAFIERDLTALAADPDPDFNSKLVIRALATLRTAREA